jgi:putative two-component system response regulator
VSAKGRPVILAVDDDSDLLALMAKALSVEYTVITAAEGGAAMVAAEGEPRPDLILLDVEMPEVSGFEVCRALKGEARTADIPVIFLTGKTETQAQVEGFESGAVDYITKPINSKVLKARVRMHLALADRRHELERLVQERTAQLERTRTELIRRLGRAMSTHESSAVSNRVMRLAQYAKLIAQAAGAKPQVCEMMAIAAPLHDVGKLGVPSEILGKKEKLSAPDWERIKRHPKIGADIIGEHDDPLLKLARQIALTHHENWDGSGYPDGLKADAIPWPGRVMAVVDSYEAMTATQFYREPRKPDDAAFEIEKLSGKRYDPKVVEAFKKALPAMEKVRESLSDALGDLINLDFAKPAPKGAAAAAKPESAAKAANRTDARRK